MILWTLHGVQVRKIIERHPQGVQAPELEWGRVLDYVELLPGQRLNYENRAASAALSAAYRISQTAAWASPLLDRYAARIDMAGELHAVLDAAQDIAAVRKSVGPQPPAAYVDQWKLDTGALDQLGEQVQRRASVLLQYESTIMRLQESLDDIAHQDHRRAAASAVDDLVHRRGGDELATEIAVNRAAEADAAEAAARTHLEAAHALKTVFDQPFAVRR